MGDDHGKHFSEEGFFDKLGEIGGTLREYAVLLYVLMQDSETPAWTKVAIVAALGYLIWPFDAVPDLIPFAGYVDDLAVLTGLLLSLDDLITSEMRQTAESWRTDH